MVFKDLKIIKKNSNNRINRVLETITNFLMIKFGQNTKYKKKLSIKEIISNFMKKKILTICENNLRDSDMHMILPLLDKYSESYNCSYWTKLRL